jgi:hypothetical protein
MNYLTLGNVRDHLAEDSMMITEEISKTSNHRKVVISALGDNFKVINTGQWSTKILKRRFGFNKFHLTPIYKIGDKVLRLYIYSILRRNLTKLHIDKLDFRYYLSKIVPTKVVPMELPISPEIVLDSNHKILMY